ncbi:hypothetical protein TCAL_08293 [Tigriopus californicus]|uniref:VWFA domain-containing protein n=1 Tax=Tigriopus californicus TaxID=6832 RepID=A0A553NCA6_TIGCA|nr:hypothetical protein TCAL_08293 [Tigriopus californicus]
MNLVSSTWLLQLYALVLLQPCLMVTISNDLELVDNGYENLVITVNPDVNPESRAKLISGIQKWIQDGSKQLYKSTQKYAYIKTVKILVPKSWHDFSDIDGTTFNLVLDDGRIQVDLGNPVFGDMPYVEQTGDCGSRNNLLHVTGSFLEQVADETFPFLSWKNHFVHLWSQLQYGVFEEYGYPGDTDYPNFWYADDGSLKPTYCSDRELQGVWSSWETGGSCIPENDPFCFFEVIQGSNAISSSIMSMPFKEQTVQYCSGTADTPHNDLIPTKQNVICQGQPIWTLVSQSEEFNADGFLPGTDPTAPDTKLEVLVVEPKPTVLVLDTSLSMAADGSDRLSNLIVSVKTWLTEEVPDGNKFGIVRFSNDSQILLPVTEMNDDTRAEAINVMDHLSARGLTCLGQAVKRGLEALQNEPGGVMLFATDGRSECFLSVDNSTLQDVLNDVKNSGIRLVAVAIGDDGDPGLEALAEASNGKVFYVPDGQGPEGLRKVLLAMSNYQSLDSRHRRMQKVVELTKEDWSNSEVIPFTIDPTIGKSSILRLWTNTSDLSAILDSAILTYQDQTLLDLPIPTDQNRLAFNWDSLQIGEYSLILKVKSTDVLAFSIESESSSPEIFPYKVECYASSTKDHDLSAHPLKIIAKVTQGNLPIIQAHVKATLSYQDQTISVELFDNGQGADLIAYDGIYSRYMTQISVKGRYSLSCSAQGENGTTWINMGTIDKSLGILNRTIASPICCGSSAVNENSELSATGAFQRVFQSGSIQIANVPILGSFPPSPVRNLRVKKTLAGSLAISFTSPGDDYDCGTAKFYDVRLSNNVTLLKLFGNDVPSLDALSVISGSLDPREAGSPIRIEVEQPWSLFPNQSVYFAMKSEDHNGNFSSISNIVKISTTVDDSSYPDVYLSHILTAILVPGLTMLAWIQDGSSFLYSATQRYAYIKHVKILVPKSWNYAQATPTSEFSLEDGNIVVDTGNPVFGNGPYTVQTGQCGERGENIMVSQDYLLGLTSTSTENYGPPSHVFVHEWAKYRYGVFEEHGYPADERFPMYYLKTGHDANGLFNELIPNFCTNKPLQGRWTDGFETCALGDSNTPGDSCFFVPDSGSTNEAIRSSILAVPFLEQMDHFCEDNDGAYSHDFVGPTKHNALCDSRSVWNVISSNSDFQEDNFKPGPEGSSNSTTFEILRPDEARFVMVIDKSGSMDGPKDHPRIKRLKQASARWILNDIWNGSSLGISSFCYNADANDMTVVSEETRQTLVDQVMNIRTCDYTCLGLGFKKGVEVLTQGGKNSGGVMIYITDGDWNCNDDHDHDDSNLNDPAIKKLIEDYKIKVITLAFSKGADPNLENLAKWSNGKTYFIPDGEGIEDLNDALSGSLTYQPAVPTGDMEFIILQDSFSNLDNPTGDQAKQKQFIIDRTLGRNVKLSFDFTEGDTNSVEEIKFFKAGCQEATCIKNIDLSDIKTLHIQHIEPTLEEGRYQLEVITSQKVEFCSVVVASQSKEETTKPFRTKCWSTIGNDEVDVAQHPVGIIAQVTQDNKPVMNAKVIANIERAGEAQAISITLFDDGKGPDLIANDGLYSRYFARFDEDGRYLIRCQVQGDENTNVNGGFTNSRIYPAKPGLAAPLCCGSNTLMPGTLQEPTGDFERTSAGGSIKVKNVNGLNQVPPMRVKDFQASYDLEADTISIGFTAPGENWDDGKAKSYSIRFSESLSNLTSAFDKCDEIKTAWAIEGDLEPLKAREPVRFVFNSSTLLKDTAYFFGVKATNGRDIQSDLSNIVSLALAPRTDLSEDPFDPVGLSGGAIAGIVIGSLLGLFVIIFIVYVLVVKKWRKSLVYAVSAKKITQE